MARFCGSGGILTVGGKTLSVTKWEAVWDRGTVHGVAYVDPGEHAIRLDATAILKLAYRKRLPSPHHSVRPPDIWMNRRNAVGFTSTDGFNTLID